MKRVFFIMITWCLMVSPGFSQDNTQKANPNAPEITFEELVHDFGTVTYRGDAECEFTFTNTGKEPLIIQNCPSQCGCTVPTCPKDKPIKSGEKATIKVKYNNTHITGPFTKQFTVQSNASNSNVKITIKGVIANNPETATAQQ